LWAVELWALQPNLPELVTSLIAKDFMARIASRVLGIFFKLILAAFGLVFAVSLIVAATVVVVFSLLKSLLTGKKPQKSVVFGRFQSFSEKNPLRQSGSNGPNGLSASRSADVVDVEAREVSAEKRLQ
jgi:hypothetical protein